MGYGATDFIVLISDIFYQDISLSHLLEYYVTMQMCNFLCFSYEQSTRHERMGYEEEFMRFLQSLLADVERRIRKGQARLCLNNTQGSVGHVCDFLLGISPSIGCISHFVAS